MNLPQPIVIVGNAESVLHKERDVDGEYATIIRMNKGFPKGKERHIGSRTDVLALSMGLDVETIHRQYAPREIFWMTPKHHLMTDYIRRNATVYPLQRWWQLQARLGARPTTGCMLVDWVAAGEGYSVDLIGFDFFTTPTWYWAKRRHIPHKPLNEKEYIKTLHNVAILQ